MFGSVAEVPNAKYKCDFLLSVLGVSRTYLPVIHLPSVSNFRKDRQETKWATYKTFIATKQGIKKKLKSV